MAEKTDELAVKTEEYYQKKEFIAGIKFVEMNEDKMKFQVLKSALNMGILLILTVFVSSSSGSFLGSGVCFGLLFHFYMKLLKDNERPLALNQWFEWVKKPVECYQRWFVMGGDWTINTDFFVKTFMFNCSIAKKICHSGESRNPAY